MIAGIGTDIVKISRINTSLEKFGRRFAEKILTKSELIEFSNSNNPAAFLSKRFAAKEAVAKALGTGMAGGVHFHQIEIGHRSTGAPKVNLSGQAEIYARQGDIKRWHISISDEIDAAIAFAVCERA